MWVIMDKDFYKNLCSRTLKAAAFIFLPCLFHGMKRNQNSEILIALMVRVFLTVVRFWDLLIV